MTSKERLHEHATKTLGLTSNIRDIIKTPKGEDDKEWLAANTFDFYNNICMLYGVVSEYCTKETCPIMNAGPKYEYLWADGVKYKKPIKVSAPEYVNLLMDWIEKQINNPKLFPLEHNKPYPNNFKRIVKNIFKRMFRVYAHIYHSHIH